jgi:hypothetical protein
VYVCVSPLARLQGGGGRLTGVFNRKSITLKNKKRIPQNSASDSVSVKVQTQAVTEQSVRYRKEAPQHRNIAVNTSACQYARVRSGVKFGAGYTRVLPHGGLGCSSGRSPARLTTAAVSSRKPREGEEFDHAMRSHN